MSFWHMVSVYYASGSCNLTWYLEPDRNLGNHACPMDPLSWETIFFLDKPPNSLVCPSTCWPHSSDLFAVYQRLLWPLAMAAVNFYGDFLTATYLVRCTVRWSTQISSLFSLFSVCYILKECVILKMSWSSPY